MSEKLQKVLARIGLGSRRYMEEVIAAGRVSVNGLPLPNGHLQFVVNDQIRL
ncbi:hypothetical protein IAF15_07950, partial [Acinetobacter baumannii]|nr:hypothetical protein [Acinetobacter baumannii]